MANICTEDRKHHFDDINLKVSASSLAVKFTVTTPKIEKEAVSIP